MGETQFDSEDDSNFQNSNDLIHDSEGNNCHSGLQVQGCSESGGTDVPRPVTVVGNNLNLNINDIIDSVSDSELPQSSMDTCLAYRVP